jgi:ABC-type nitrate/sulfonate/bicarbonate transport system substrate-binding protein
VSGNKIAAAALPGSMLELARAQGLKVIASDDLPYGSDSAINASSDTANVSQSVMVARTAWAQNNDELINKIANAWDAAVELINKDPQSYLTILAANANLNDAVLDSYTVSDYPFAAVDGVLDAGLAHPDNWMVDAVLTWMKDKDYLSSDITYSASTGSLS